MVEERRPAPSAGECVPWVRPSELVDRPSPRAVPRGGDPAHSSNRRWRPPGASSRSAGKRDRHPRRGSTLGPVGRSRRQASGLTAERQSGNRIYQVLMNVAAVLRYTGDRARADLVLAYQYQATADSGECTRGFGISPPSDPWAQIARRSEPSRTAGPSRVGCCFDPSEMQSASRDPSRSTRGQHAMVCSWPASSSGPGR